MNNATIAYGAGNDRPGTLTAATDREAVQIARKLVRDGYRNEAWASAYLTDGRTYQARNAHGRVVARYIPAL